MKRRQSGRADWLKVECDFGKVNSKQVEACCYYEYFRESAAMREAFKEVRPMPLKGYRDEDGDYARLSFALRMAGFPVQWNQLNCDRRKELANVLAWRAKDKRKHPPLVVSELPLECFYHPDVQDEELKRWWEKAYVAASFSDAESFPYHDGHSYCYGLFRLDESYNETEAGEAFKTWFTKRRDKTKGGGRNTWKAKLNNLVVMRIWNKERDQWKRLKLVAELCGYKGCKEELVEYEWRCGQGRGPDEPMSSAAKVEMSSARSEARIFFQGLFPGEEPLSY
jgi:hypothetical protein